MIKVCACDKAKVAYLKFNNYRAEYYMQIEFAWDEKKNAINQKKHDVSFEEAKTCFEDEYALLNGMA